MLLVVLGLPELHGLAELRLPRPTQRLSAHAAESHAGIDISTTRRAMRLAILAYRLTELLSICRRLAIRRLAVRSRRELPGRHAERLLRSYCSRLFGGARERRQDQPHHRHEAPELAKRKNAQAHGHFGI